MGTVYFVTAEGLDLVKIGFTENDPLKRLSALQTGSPLKLRILGLIEGVSLQIEKSIHQILADHRIIGEWFESEAAEQLLCTYSEPAESDQDDDDFEPSSIPIPFPMVCIPFRSWLMNHKADDNPVGDLAMDAATDRAFPSTGTLEKYTSYLCRKNACFEAIEALQTAFAEYWHGFVTPQ